MKPKIEKQNELQSIFSDIQSSSFGTVKQNLSRHSIKKSTFNSNSQNSTSSFKSALKAVSKRLKNEYTISKGFYKCKLINDIIFNEKSRAVAIFKDYLIYDDNSEFLKRFYKRQELKDRLIKIFRYYTEFSKIFPNYIILLEAKYIYKNIQRKQRMIDNQQVLELKDKKRSTTKISGKIDFNKGNNSDEIFDSQIMHSIMNVSCSQLILNDSLIETTAMRNSDGLSNKFVNTNSLENLIDAIEGKKKPSNPNSMLKQFSNQFRENKHKVSSIQITLGKLKLDVGRSMHEVKQSAEIYGDKAVNLISSVSEFKNLQIRDSNHRTIDVNAYKNYSSQIRNFPSLSPDNKLLISSVLAPDNILLKKNNQKHLRNSINSKPEEVRGESINSGIPVHQSIQNDMTLFSKTLSIYPKETKEGANGKFLHIADDNRTLELVSHSIPRKSNPIENKKKINHNEASELPIVRTNSVLKQSICKPLNALINSGQVLSNVQYARKQSRKGEKENFKFDMKYSANPEIDSNCMMANAQNLIKNKKAASADSTNLVNLPENFRSQSNIIYIINQNQNSHLNFYGTQPPYSEETAKNNSIGQEIDPKYLKFEENNYHLTQNESEDKIVENYQACDFIAPEVPKGKKLKLKLDKDKVLQKLKEKKKVMINSKVKEDEPQGNSNTITIKMSQLQNEKFPNYKRNGRIIEHRDNLNEIKDKNKLFNSVKIPQTIKFETIRSELFNSTKSSNFDKTGSSINAFNKGKGSMSYGKALRSTGSGYFNINQIQQNQQSLIPLMGSSSSSKFRTIAANSAVSPNNKVKANSKFHIKTNSTQV